MHPLHEYANTDQQREYLRLTHEGANHAQACRALGVGERRARYTLKNIKARAVLQGWSPEHDMVHKVPEPMMLKGTSTLYKDGAPVLQWVKTRTDDERRRDMWLEAVQDVAQTLPAFEPVKQLTETTSANLCNLYTLTDTHIGMLAWGQESGADWDLGIAEHLLCSAFLAMIRASPAAKYCVINQLGDFMHYDSLDSVTPQSKHQLDADSRFAKMVRVAIRVYRTIVAQALERHDHVHLMAIEGNHDPASSVLHREWLKAFYANEPRVTVDDSPLPYATYRHGKTLLAFHHGHKKKVGPDLALYFAAMEPKAWGETTKRYIHTGHLHHERVIEQTGVKFIQHPTLAAPDAYAARGGWWSERQVTAYSYHDVYGMHSSHVIVPEMFSERAPQKTRKRK